MPVQKKSTTRKKATSRKSTTAKVVGRIGRKAPASKLATKKARTNKRASSSRVAA